MHTDCIKCFFDQANKVLLKYDIPNDIASSIVEKSKLFIDNHKDLNAPEVSSFMYRLIKKETRVEDPYEKEKNDYNKLLLSLEDNIRDIIKKSANSFNTALRYALAGNIIDFGPSEPFDVFKALSEAAITEPAINHVFELKKAIKKASTILYLGDNAGEIVLDKLFIENINHSNLYFAVRGNNIINDVTIYDAENTGITKIAKVISNGYDAPSTILTRCSSEFMKIYNKADIVISKGQGNLEGLIDVSDKKIFFLLMVKCNVMAELIGVQKKSVVVLYNKKIVHQKTNPLDNFKKYPIVEKDAQY